MEKSYMTMQDIDQLKSYRTVAVDAYKTEQKILQGLLRQAKILDDTNKNSKTTDPRVLKDRETVIPQGLEAEKNLPAKIKKLLILEKQLYELLANRKTVSEIKDKVFSLKLHAQSFEVTLSELRRLRHVLNPSHAANVKRGTECLDPGGYLTGVEKCDFKQVSTDVHEFGEKIRTLLRNFDLELKEEAKKVAEVAEIEKEMEKQKKSNPK